jgi:hypothetical protein
MRQPRYQPVFRRFLRENARTAGFFELSELRMCSRREGCVTDGFDSVSYCFTPANFESLMIRASISRQTPASRIQTIEIHDSDCSDRPSRSA